MNPLSATALSSTPSDVAEPPYLSGLNPEQRLAVETTDGPVLVLAGAGTGKTKVLTTRIAHILRTGRAYPGQILAVTFTNKAAREMGQRVAATVGYSPAPVSDNAPAPANPSMLQWLGTFHSIAARLLRRHAELVGLNSNFTILDTDDRLRLLKTILTERNVDDKAYPAKLFGAIIDQWKDQGLTPEKVSQAEAAGQAGGSALGVYHAYQERLRTLNAADFGDLLLHNLTIFTMRPEILQEYSQRFKYILVDEYQDTNVSQYLWLRLLATGHRNLCCVGDDDQSIYSWRGAEVGNILRFEKDFPGAAVIRLERNYRSTKHILGAASGLIARNKGRLGKTLWTDTEAEAESVRVRSVWDENEEARVIGDEIETLQRKQEKLDEIAVLVRAGFQTRAFEERFLTLGLAYRVVGGLRFYERQEIRDAVAYLRVIAQPDDDLALERIINLPRRGIGKATLELMHRSARSHQVSLMRAIGLLLDNGELTGKVGTTLRNFIASLERWRGLLVSHNPSEMADEMLNESGYRAMWQQEKTPDAQGRLENLRELIRAMQDFETLQDFLDHVGLVTDIYSEERSEMVTLMTLHGAKGLEWTNVFLPGWEEGLFPHQRSMDEKGTAGLEEERRLAYVGITRGRKRVFITHAANRRIYNQWQVSLPSRFIEELPQEHIEYLGGGVFGMRNSYMQEQPRSMQPVAPASVITQKHPVGTRIFHQKFGYGTIISSQGDHLEIAFEKAGTKKILADFVEKIT